LYSPRVAAEGEAEVEVKKTPALHLRG